MKTLIYILLTSQILLLCSFTPTGSDNLTITPEEIKTDSEILANGTIDPERFYNQEFLRPRVRGGVFMSTNETYNEALSAALQPITSSDSIRRRQFVASKLSEDEFKQAKLLQQKREEALKTVIERRLTPERQEIIRQMRQIAADHCTLGLDHCISLELTKEEAVANGISEFAYDNFKEWVASVNKSQTQDQGFVTNAPYGFIFVYFDDNLFDKNKDILIRNPK